MPQTQHNMFLVCVTVGLVFLASKYRNNVLRSVKHICHSIRNRGTAAAGGNVGGSGANIGGNRQEDPKKQLKITLEKIILADSPEKCDYAVQRIRCNLSNGVLGFDCEWVNDGPVALLQLATFNGVCALFRIGKIGYIPTKLKELLASKKILKVGVASFEDGRKIVKDYGCKVCGTLDLRTMAESMALPSPKSLAAMSLHYLGLEMDKIIEVRCGDWNVCTLADEQVAYAACDAIASVLIYDQIVQRRNENCTLWQNCLHYVKSMFSEDVGVRFHGLPSGIIDRRFKDSRTESSSCRNTRNNNNNNNNNNHISIQPVTSKLAPNERSNSSVAGYKTSVPTRNKPLYHNCYLQAPDGDILCTCDRKKAEWYVTKHLGEIVDTEPFTVRLKFEPSGRALGEVGQYYTQVKVNQCVVCGMAVKFIRKNVVPREYRKYFPVIMKAHQSHDVLLLCPSCHETSSYHDLQLRRKLADMCDAPLIGPLTLTRNKQTNNWRKLYSAVKALRESDVLPDARRKELEEYILENTGHQTTITSTFLDALSDQLKDASFRSSALERAKCQPHGLKVVQYFQRKEGGLVELERMWREHFLVTMKPSFLPNLWSVRHNQERLEIRQTQNRIEPEDAKVAGLAH